MIETLEQFVELVEANHLWFQQCNYGEIRNGRNCPIVELAEKLTGQQFLSENYEDAAQAIGLNNDVAEFIVYASDHNQPTVYSNELFVPWLRERMLTWCTSS